MIGTESSSEASACPAPSGLPVTASSEKTLERAIPIAIDTLVKALQERLAHHLDTKQLAAFALVCVRLQWLYRADQTQQFDRVRHAYAAFSPDQTHAEKPLQLSSGDEAEKLRVVKNELEALLTKANFTQLSEAALNLALNKTSPHGVEVSVDMTQYGELALWYRGLDSQQVIRRNWKTLYIKSITEQVAIYRKLFLLVRKNDTDINLNASEPNAEDQDSNSIPPVHIKLFRDIPLSDLEMLFPDSKVRIRLFDKIKLGITGGGGTVAGAATTLTKLAAAAEPFTIIVAIGGFAAILWRQIAKIFTQRNKYLINLSKRLYFYNLDNNMGAVAYLAEMARAEDVKEAMLAYSFLIERNMEEGMSRTQLDAAIEDFLQQDFACRLDYEIDDGVRKLIFDGLVTNSADDSLFAVDPERANQLLEQRWEKLLPSSKQ